MSSQVSLGFFGRITLKSKVFFVIVNKSDTRYPRSQAVSSLFGASFVVSAPFLHHDAHKSRLSRAMLNHVVLHRYSVDEPDLCLTDCGTWKQLEHMWMGLVVPLYFCVGCFTHATFTNIQMNKNRICVCVVAFDHQSCSGGLHLNLSSWVSISVSVGKHK